MMYLSLLAAEYSAVRAMISPSWNTDLPFFSSRRSDASPGGLGISAHGLASARMSVAEHKASSEPKTADAAQKWRGTIKCVSKGVSLERSAGSGKYKRTNRPLCQFKYSTSVKEEGNKPPRDFALRQGFHIRPR